MQSSPPSRLSRAILALASAFSLFFVATSASAQMVDAGGRGSIVFDDLSGFRATSIGGVGYAGPIGFSVHRA